MAPDPLSAIDIARRLEAHGFSPEPRSLACLAGFLKILMQWNRVHNLTGIRDRNELIDRHLVESLALAPYLKGPRVADIGSGGGLPGVPLAISLPELSFVLIESRRKRASFLRQVKLDLGLDNVEVEHARAEALVRPPFSTVLARAVAEPGRLLALVEPMLEPDGRLVTLTSIDRAREIRALAGGFEELPIAPAVPGIRSTIVVLERRVLSWLK